MRIAGAILVFIGLVATLVGTFSGCGSLFSWNGRHVVESRPLPEGPVTQELVPEASKRYTLGVQVVFDRTDLPKKDDGAVALEAKLPLTVRVTDRSGTKLSEVTGWLDPNEPPNVLYGQAAKESLRGPMPELLVERLVGPFSSASVDPLRIDVDLGRDRVGQTPILARRLVVHDDGIPPSVRNAFVLGASGVAAFVAGVVVFVVGWFRRPARVRRGNRARDLV